MTSESEPGAPGSGPAAGHSTTSPSGHRYQHVDTGRSWWVIVAALIGLLLGVAVASIVSVGVTVNVGAVTDHAVSNDLELEDEADDLVVAILNVRNDQRNLLYTGPTRNGLAEYDRAVGILLDELEQLEAVEITAPDAPQASELRAMVDEYLAGYRPALALYESDRAGFDEAHDAGLAQLADLLDEAAVLDALGEDLAADALQDVERTTSTATVLLLAVMLVVLVAALVLTVAALRVLRQQRELQVAQQETASALVRALRTRTDFIADASHELRTPLTVLRGNAEVGLVEGTDHCGHEPVLREIVAESERMTRLVEDLLLLARFDAGSVPLQAVDVDVEPWLADVAARAEMLARARGVSVALDLAATGRACLDAERMQQVVLVLVDNAAKFSPAGGTVELCVCAPGDFIEIEVADRGPGIPEEIRPDVFERFYRAEHTRVQQGGGAGLGLSIAKAIVDAHGGRIEARSRAGGGTTMWVSVPRAARAATLQPDARKR